jgi:hypothetical protein
MEKGYTADPSALPSGTQVGSWCTFKASGEQRRGRSLGFGRAPCSSHPPEMWDKAFYFP